MKVHPLLFLDLETTGHDPLKRVGQNLVPWHEIIDIGGILVDPERLSVVAEFEKKVMPAHAERCLPDLVNRYRERAARGEWLTGTILPVAIHKLLWFAGSTGETAILLGQNFFFDWNFLSVAFAACGIEESEWKKFLHYTRLDVRSMAAQALLGPGEVYDPDEFSMRNSRLLKRLGIDPEPEVHEAINGARKSFEVYRKLRELRADR